MEVHRIAELLQPYLATPLSEQQLEHISIYIDILLRWNQRMNLTAVRDVSDIVSRHFGESLFAAQKLFSGTTFGSDSVQQPQPKEGPRVVDIGSGAGFPGLPIRIFNPDIQLTLIESNQKKSTFLREVVRALELTGVEVFTGRAESFPAASADVVTLRAVERFEHVLPVAAAVAAPGARLGLLIGGTQISAAKFKLPGFQWDEPISIPNSQARVLQVGYSPGTRR